MWVAPTVAALRACAFCQNGEVAGKPMAGKVFISCGQRNHERDLANRIAKLLREEFHLTPYLAFKTQSLSDIMTITEELRSSDYYLFVDFLRSSDDSRDLACSLFTHQELALAHHLGFRDDMIALQQAGAPLEGFLRYVLSNPEPFDGDADLIERIRDLVRERGWSPTYSRNLVLAAVRMLEPLVYQDHTGSNTMRVWNAKIENRRPDVAAVRAACILDEIESGIGIPYPSPDRSYLKWSGQATYENTILPKDYGEVTLCCTHQNEQGLFLVSARDVVPRSPIVTQNGRYLLRYKVFSEGFPLLKFAVRFHLQCPRPTLPAWDTSIAEIEGPDS